MTPWVIGLCIEHDTTPCTAEWSLAFSDVLPVATALGLGIAEQVDAILDAHHRIVASREPEVGVEQAVDPGVFHSTAI